MWVEVSPVKAPSLLQETFWPAMAMLVPLVASTAVEMAVNGGARMISQCAQLATSGLKAAKNARVSASVLYIFQLPAMTRRRFAWLIYLFERDSTPGSLRPPRNSREAPPPVEIWEILSATPD